MHEYSIAYDLYATARTAALEHKATKVKKISVEVGKMAMVNSDQVVFLFNTIREDDPLFEQAVLDCRDVDPETKCPCGYTGSEIGQQLDRAGQGAQAISTPFRGDKRLLQEEPCIGNPVEFCLQTLRGGGSTCSGVICSS